MLSAVGFLEARRREVLREVLEVDRREDLEAADLVRGVDFFWEVEVFEDFFEWRLEDCAAEGAASLETKDGSVSREPSKIAVRNRVQTFNIASLRGSPPFYCMPGARV